MITRMSKSYRVILCYTLMFVDNRICSISICYFLFNCKLITLPIEILLLANASRTSSETKLHFEYYFVYCAQCSSK